MTLFFAQLFEIQNIIQILADILVAKTYYNYQLNLITSFNKKNFIDSWNFLQRHIISLFFMIYLHIPGISALEGGACPVDAVVIETMPSSSLTLLDKKN